jgi:drug/metabolite transporter (DMT)-like permease
MERRSSLGFLALAGLWGSAPVAIKIGIGGAVPPILLAAVRYDVAGIVVLGYAAFATDRLRPRGRNEWAEIAVGGLTLIAGHQVFLFTGIRYTTAAGAAVLLSFVPVFTAALARVLLPDEETGWDLAVALVLGFAGAALTAGPSAAVGSGEPGAFLVLFAALSFAVGSVLTRRLPSTLPRASAQAWTMLVGAVVLHAGSALAFGEPQAAAWTPSTLAALAYLALGASALGFFLYFGLLDRLGAVSLNLVTYALPLVAAIAGWIVLGERPTALTAVGFACALAAFAVLRRAELWALVRGSPSPGR